MNRTHAGVGAAILLPVGIVAVLAVTPAEAEEQLPPAPPAPPAVSVENKAGQDVLDAMERDLGLEPDEARARIESDQAAGRTERKLRKKLGRSFGGAYITPDGQSLVVTVTDEAKARVVAAAGAIPKVVENSEAALDSTLDDVSEIAAKAPAAEVTGWYVDPATNKVVVETAGSVATAEKLVESTDADTDAVEVVKTAEQPQTMAEIRGGDAYAIPKTGGACSMGFAVEGGYITAGHCGQVDFEAQTMNLTPMGVFQVSSFPENDYAFVATKGDFSSRGVINNYGGGAVAVKGIGEVTKGAAVCRTGVTTGWQCGTVETVNRTVVYKDKRIVKELTETTACAEGGDSGGPFVAGTKALGILSGGSGDCKVAANEVNTARTFFQPIQEILAANGIPSDIVKDDGQGACRDYDKDVVNTISADKGSAAPLGQYYYSKSGGRQSACLSGPDGTDFDVYLQYYDSKQGWTIVGRGRSGGSTEVVSYDGPPGYYAWTVRGIAGLGEFQFAYSVTQ